MKRELKEDRNIVCSDFGPDTEPFPMKRELKGFAVKQYRSGKQQRYRTIPYEEGTERERFSAFLHGLARDTEPFPMKRELKAYNIVDCRDDSGDTEPFPMKRELKDQFFKRFAPSNPVIQNHSL